MQVDAQNGADPRWAELASDAIVDSLRDLNVFKIISSDDIKKILSFERTKQLVTGTCTEESCLAEIGGALGADYMVSGKLSKIGTTSKLELRLFNNAQSKVDNAVSRDGLGDEKSLVEAAKLLARRVVAPLLEKNSGQFFVTITDPGAAGATIVIDDKATGITVPPGTQAPPIILGWGPHHVTIQKEGFLTFEKDIQIDEGQSTTTAVTLVPSPDFVASYRSFNWKLRIGAYATAVLTVGLAAGSVYANYVNINQYKQYQNGLAAYNNSATVPYPNVGSCSGCSSLQGLSQAAARGNSTLLASQLMAGGAVASAVASTILFVVGSDPHRYDSFVEPVSSSPSSSAPTAAAPISRSLIPTVGLAPLPGGGVAALGLSF